ncbi:radical SAM protein [Chitinimonas lacunae]|uniref:Radical SAM protein n=1 Tax=Chitinimonas lacunae TaxID=1963018 RepID=A0ABV8MT22_9NEIS
MYLPAELDLRTTAHLPSKVHPFGIGYTMHGWDYGRLEVEAAINAGRMLNPAAELASNVCALNCFFCYTEDPANQDGLKQKLSGEMNLQRKLELIDEFAALGARSVNIVGAGEPLIDPDFWRWTSHIAESGMVPLVYTEGTAAGNYRKGLHNPEVAQRLYELGATVVLKVNSLADHDYQNRIVMSGDRARKKPLRLDYFALRQQALATLIATGFTRHDPTRLGFDTIVCRENYAEILDIHRYARDNNIFVLFVNYLPSGRSTTPLQNAISRDEEYALFQAIAEYDARQHQLVHDAHYPYAGGVPCTIRGTGVLVRIQGSVWDCPGMSEHLGELSQAPLAQLYGDWIRRRQTFDGGCPPRDMAMGAYHKVQVIRRIERSGRQEPVLL